MDGCSIAIVGATGAVGSVFLHLLEERNFPARSIRLCASERSWGKKMKVSDRDLIVEPATPQLFQETDIVFVSAGSDTSRDITPIAVDQGAVVIDNSSAFRAKPDVPLVVPEINGEDLTQHAGVIAVPNCSTAPLVMVLNPLNHMTSIQRVIASTYQSVSGTGAAAMEELRSQVQVGSADSLPTPTVYPHQIAFNVIPHVESFQENGYTSEEMKMVNETRKILHLPDLQVSATCVRVPVMVGHSEAVNIEFNEPVDLQKVSEVLSAAPGIKVVDDPLRNSYPMPLDAEGIDDVLVGRIRQDTSNPNGVVLWIASDNLRKGAALNAIQIAEQLLSRNLLGKLTGRV